MCGETKSLQQAMLFARARARTYVENNIVKYAERTAHALISTRTDVKEEQNVC